MDISVIVMAAGRSKRMKSSTPKVLHKIANVPILEIILITLKKLKLNDIRIVVSKSLLLNSEFQRLQAQYEFKIFKQNDALGTADAVKCALLKGDDKPYLILNADCPLIKSTTIKQIYATFIDKKLDLLCTAFQTKNPKGYGRLIIFGEDLIEIVEEKDLDNDQQTIDLCNGGTYMVDYVKINLLLSKIEANNLASELYLTDIVKNAYYEGHQLSFIKVNSIEMLGINTPKQKAKVENLIQKRLRNKVLSQGTTLLDPNTIYLSYDTKFGCDVILHQFIKIGPNVTVGDGSEILSFSDIDNTTIGQDCKIGPFARLRAGSTIHDNVKIGNFVECKTSIIQCNSKAAHLTYIGDAEVGKNVNIGAGTIFCNFDGFDKHKTIVDDNAFIGSNVALIAPISIGKNSKIGAGSVITENISDNELAIARSRQSNFKILKNSSKKVTAKE